MENATNALRMAAGCLMAVILISLIVYVFNITSDLENSKRDQEVAEETSEFNQRFLAFDKTSMYGTDLISVIGLAISNNKIYNQEIMSNPNGQYNDKSQYSINIIFTLKEPVTTKTTTEVYREKIVGNEYTLVKDDTLSKEETNDTVLAAGKHELKNELSDYEAIEDIAIDANSTVTVTNKQKGTRLYKITKDTSGYNSLKKGIFQCTKVEYNNVGRVYQMTFNQIE